MSLLNGPDKASVRASLLGNRGQRATPSSTLLLDLLTQRRISCVTAFVSMADEPDTSLLRAIAVDAGIRVALPVLLEDNSLRWATESGELSPGLRGTSYPSGPAISLSEVGAMVIPALAIDHSGRRLGRGGGSYDRALAQFRAARPGGLVVAWVSEADVIAEVPVESHDQPVDAAITEQRVIWFRLSTQ